MSNQYRNMTSEEKDEICDNSLMSIQKFLEQRVEITQDGSHHLNQDENERISTNQNLKRNLTSTSITGEDEGNGENDQFQLVTNSNRRKHPRLNNGNQNNGSDEANDIYLDEQNSRYFFRIRTPQLREGGKEKN